VFVSSPGDVGPERRAAEFVLNRLRDQFATECVIEPYFWEYAPLTASHGFQKQIPSPAKMDICVCILWSRLGRPLSPAEILSQHGDCSLESGTAYEFDEALRGKATVGRPDLLVYVKKQSPRFPPESDANRGEAESQFRKLREFLRSRLENDDGTLRRASHEFQTGAEFATLLERHVVSLIEPRLQGANEKKRTWRKGSPFRGLDAFELEHAPIFFGRKADVRRIVQKLERQAGVVKRAQARLADAGSPAPTADARQSLDGEYVADVVETAGEFVVVVGPSGSGKSSLAKAGVLNRFVEGWGGDHPLRPFAVVRPGVGKGPLEALASALSAPQAFPAMRGDFAERLRDDPGGAQTYVREALATAAAEYAAASADASQPKLFLVVDQLEELFSREDFSDDDRHAFAAAIASLATSGTTWVLATLRSDFYDRFTEIPEFVDLKSLDGQYDLLPPKRSEIDDMILRPAYAAGLSYETRDDRGALYDVLREDAARNPNGLPLLEFALELLYRHARESEINVLSFAAYDAIGGIGEAIARCADRAVGSVSDEAQRTRDRLFQKLVQVSLEEDRPVRRSASQAEFADPASKELVDALVAARLLTPSGDRLEWSHESILSHWAPLSEWIARERPLLYARTRVEAAYAEWFGKGRPADELITTKSLLREAREATERGFFDAAGYAAVRKFLYLSWEAERKRRYFRRFVNGVIYFLLLAAIAGAIFAFGEQKSHRTTMQAKTRLLQDASLERHRARDDGTSAVLLGLALKEAEGLDEGLQEEIRRGITVARSRLLPLRSILNLNHGEQSKASQARACAVSPDGRLALVGMNTGEVHGIDPTTADRKAFGAAGGGTRYVVGSHDDDRVTALAFAPRGESRFAVATEGGDIHIVKTDGGRPLIISHPGRPHAVVFTPDGKRLIVGGFPPKDSKKHPEPAELAIYDLDAGGRSERKFRLGYGVYGAAVSDDGTWLAAGGGVPPNPRLTVWNLREPNSLPRDLSQQPSRIFTLAFRPHHPNQFVTGDVNGTVRFWDMSNEKGREVVGEEISYEKQVRLTTFSQDGRLLLVGGESAMAQVWDADSRRPVGQALSHRDQVRAGVLTPNIDGKVRAVTADFAGEVRHWDLMPDVPAIRTFSHASPVSDAIFSEDDEYVLTGFASNVGETGGARLWRISDGRAVDLPHGADVLTARFRPGVPHQVVTGGNDGKVAFWDFRGAIAEKYVAGESNATAERIGEPLTLGGPLVFSSAFSPDGNRFAYAGFGKSIRVFDWDTTTNGWRQAFNLEHAGAQGYVWGLRFGKSRDDLFSEGGNAVRMWSLGAAARSHDFGHPDPKVKEAAEVLLADLDITSDGVLVRWTDGQTAVFHAADTTRAPLFLGDRPHGPGRGAADWSSDGRLIATGGADGVVRIWSPDGIPQTLNGTSIPAEFRHPSAVKMLCFSPDARWLATACQDGAVRLWSMQTGNWSGAGWYHDGPVTRLRFSNGGKYVLSTGRDGTARVVPLAEKTEGPADRVLATLEADTGIRITISGTGATASFTAPQPLSAEEFRSRRDSH
jgi:WD40 repeat protein